MAARPTTAGAGAPRRGDPGLVYVRNVPREDAPPGVDEAATARPLCYSGRGQLVTPS